MADWDKDLQHQGDAGRSTASYANSNPAEAGKTKPLGTLDSWWHAIVYTGSKPGY